MQKREPVGIELRCPYSLITVAHLMRSLMNGVPRDAMRNEEPLLAVN
jgi:hypothetical protein